MVVVVVVGVLGVSGLEQGRQTYSLQHTYLLQTLGDLGQFV